MERYNKYLVVKTEDIEKFLTDEQQLKLSALTTKIEVGRLNEGKQPQQYVCVAADWPMYETVWGMVEAFVDGKPDEITQLRARVLELEKERDAAIAEAEDIKRLFVKTCGNSQPERSSESAISCGKEL